MHKKTTHVIVKSNHPIKKQVVGLVLMIGVAAGGWSLFEYGRSRAGFDALQAGREREVLLARLGEAEARNEELSAQNAVLTQAGEIDRHAYSEVDRSLADLQNELAELKQEVAFYRGIVNPAGALQGVHVQSFMLSQDGQSQNYRYRLILTQYATSNRFVQGVTKIYVTGTQGEGQTILSQQDLVSGGGEGITFRFKYFQEIEGNLALPEDFVPQRITLKAIVRGQEKQPVERTFNWSELVSS